MTGRISRGARVRTNSAFADLIMEEDYKTQAKLPWCGEVKHPHATIEGCWAVMFDGIPALQFINEVYVDLE